MCSSAIFVFGIAIILHVTQGNLGDIANHLIQKREISNQFPYLAKLGYQTKFGLIWGCTGALTFPTNTILTANFCISQKAYGGNLNIVQIENRNYSVLEKKVVTDEIGAVILDKNTDSAKACILKNPSIPVNTTAIIAGWGGMSPENQLHGTINKELAESMVTVLEVSKQTIKVQSTSDSPCFADRGGPLQIPSKDPECRYNVIGFLKEWKNCGEPNSFGTYIF
ncbi:Trypsin [Popillia japonica]|uniref:Trypsin n=1 Tax=Popillia japonica TaxID=7064 RepID=A0AAW1M7W2_POPJA